PSCLIILMIDPVKVIYFLIIVIIIQQLDANIFDPLIVGNSIEMSSFWVLFSVILFGGLFGFPGLLLGVPTFTILYDIIRKLTDFMLNKRGKGEMADDYRRHYHNPSDDPDLLREKARKYRRDRRHTKAEQKRISELVIEAQESGTTEAAIPLMTVVDEEAEAPLDAAETVSEAETAAEAEDGAETPSSDVLDENPSPADVQTDTPGEDTPVREEESKPETTTE
ncbi:MAG: AI-2E family transporter, partial [Clostridia bacterium]|nr:AI-2E family transporter [Clostridia bacterium]